MSAPSVRQRRGESAVWTALRQFVDIRVQPSVGQVTGERLRLVRFLPALQALSIAFGLGELLGSIVYDEAPLRWSAGLTLGFGILLTVSRRFVNLGWPGIATGVIAIALTTLSMVGPVVTAGVGSAMATLPVLALVLVLPYARGRTLVVAAVASLLASALVLVVAGVTHPSPMREPLQALYVSSIQLAALGLLIAALVDVASNAASSLTSLRDALYAQQAMRADRVAVRRLLAEIERLPTLPSPGEAADRISRALVTLPGIDFGGVLERQGNGLRVLGLSAPETFPLRAGMRLPDAHASVLLERTRAGAWAESTAIVPPEDRANIDSSGLRALAYAPVWSGDEILAIIGIGTSDPETAERLVADLPAVTEVAASASALLGPALSAHRQAAASQAEVRALIRQRAYTSVFQPVVTSPGRQVVGYEALTRFRDGRPPNEVFAEAGRAGLGVELELATLDEAVRAAERLTPADLWLALNVSPSLVEHPARVTRILRRSRHPIVLELTEHAPVADYSHLRRRLGAIGVPFRVAVDDAGAGYASMQHVVELRPSLIKLDISLIRGIDADPARQALVAGMRFFAERLDCRLLAEGVETEAELATLVSLGVSLAQGFLLGRPEPVGHETTRD